MLEAPWKYMRAPIPLKQPMNLQYSKSRNATIKQTNNSTQQFSHVKTYPIVLPMVLPMFVTIFVIAVSSARVILNNNNDIDIEEP